jgi:ribosomal protein S18 acetylase RimI-like enzyme
VLFAARDADGGIVGSAQLDLALRANGLHRAEVAKVMVHRRARRHGLGRALMLAAEDEARRRGRTTLVLDTREGDPSEILYRSLGWRLAGTIPRYAKSADGTLHTTAFYFKLLDG